MRLKASQVKAHRLDLLAQQDYKCRLCNHSLPEDQAVLDHDHKSGQIRGTIHRGCNSALGKLENAARRYKVDLQALAAGLVEYLQIESHVLHPTHRTPEEKKLLAKKRRIRKKATSL
jgi:hypothetical protein